MLKITFFTLILLFSKTAVAEKTDELGELLSEMPPERVALLTLHTSNQLLKKFAEVASDGAEEDFLWAVKSLAAGNYLLYLISPEDNPFRPCFRLRYESTATWVRGEDRSEVGVNANNEAVARCIQDGISNLQRNHGSQRLSEVTLTKHDLDFSNRILTMAMLAAAKN